MTIRKSITWTARLHEACKVLAAEPPPPAAPSVKERAQEFVDFARVGMVLEPWRVDIVQMLRSRLEPSRPIEYGGLASHAEFEAAFGEAWDASYDDAQQARIAAHVAAIKGDR
jgi:hypothetical protein